MIHTRATWALTITAILLQLSCSAGDRSMAPASSEAAGGSADPGNEYEGATVHRAQTKTLLPVVRHYTGQADMGVAATPSHYLTSEARFIGEGGIDADEIQQALGSREEFADVTRALKEDGLQSMVAQDMTRYVRKLMEQGMSGDMIISSLSCGHGVCMGTVQKQSPFEKHWSVSLLEDDALQFHAVAHSMDKIGTIYENRFVFSINPDLRGFVGSMAP